MAEKYIPRLKKAYNEEYVKTLEQTLGIDNVNKVPKLEKVVISCGVGKKREDKRFIETVNLTLSKITGQATTSRMAKNQSLPLRSVKVWVIQLAILLLFVTIKCMNSLTVLSTSLYHTFATSTVFQTILSTSKAITHWASKSRLSSQRLLLKIRQFYTALKSPLLLKMVQRKEALNC